MTVHHLKSLNGRIEYTYSKGRLSETSPETPKFTMSVIETYRLARFLAENLRDMQYYYEQAIDNKLPAYESDKEYVEGVDGGVEVNAEIVDNS